MENLKNIICIVVLCLCAFAVIKVIMLLTRTELVYKFRRKIIDNHFELYDKLPSYEEMVADGKPLKLESYFTKEDLS